MDLDAVIATHRAPLERHLRRRVGDRGLAEDLTQEVFLRAWRHAPRGLPDPRLRAWLYRVATNVAIDALRARRPHDDPVLLETLGARAAAEAPDHDERLAIETALAQLPARERALVTLQFAGYGPTDAARLLETTPEAARKRLTRARERFRRAYAQAAPDVPPLALLVVHDEREQGLYEGWLRGAGMRVRQVSVEGAARQLATAHALVLSGDRCDIHPALYGQELRGAVEPKLAEDRAIAAVLADALAHRMPVLGICHGHQLLNVVRGGTLHQDLSERGAAARPELHSERMHAVASAGSTRTRRMIGAHARVPSIHHQAVAKLGRGLRVASWSPDGFVEGIEDPRLPFAVGIQWHAELPEAGIAGRRVRDALADAAHRHAQPRALAA
jgi:putative glutamine amidotransferase